MDTDNSFSRALREVPKELRSIGSPSFTMYVANAQILENTITLHQEVAKYVSANPNEPGLSEDPSFSFGDAPQEMLDYFAGRKAVTMDVVAILMRFAIEHPELALTWLASMGNADPEQDIKDYFYGWVTDSLRHTLF